MRRSADGEALRMGTVRLPFICVCNMMPKCAGWIMLSKRFHGSACGAGGGLPFSGVLPAGAAAGAPPPSPKASEKEQ